MPGNSKERNVVLHFKMDGQVQYANTLKQINMVMNNAAKERIKIILRQWAKMRR